MSSTQQIDDTERLLSGDELLEWLHRDGIIDQQQLSQFRAGADARANDDRHPLIRIAEQGWQSATKPQYPLTLERLTRWLAEAISIPYVRIDPLKVDVAAVTKLVSQAYVARFNFLPIAVDDNTVTIVTEQPFIREWEREISRVLKRKIKRMLANPKDIARYRVEFYGFSRSIFGATNKTAEQPDSLVGNFEQLTELGKFGEPDANDQHVVHLVDWLLQYAFEQRASDIHIEPRREVGNIRFRIDGKLHLVNELPGAVVMAITSRLKSLGRMDVADKRRPQDGRIKSKTPAGDEVELRLSTMPTTFGEKLVMRIFDPQVLNKTFEEMGFNEHDLSRWEPMVEHPHGIILVTGPTGSGKTTTLYSALKRLARPELNICTIEDPIEMVEPRFNQMQVQPSVDLDFASGVRTLLRQDPDIIMVGEIRDRETANVAVQAALTGHLVFSTLHTNDAPAAITRLMDIGIQPYLIGATVLGIIAQRLVRTLCPHCKQEGRIDATVWRQLVGEHPLAAPSPAWVPTGCDDCRHTGYLGRTGIYEILRMNEALRDSIKPDSNAAQLKRLALNDDMRELRISAAYLVCTGQTTVEEALAIVAPGPANSQL